MSQLCLILFGAPGSGKGTQAKLISKALSLPHISTGDMLRESVERGDDLGHEVRAILAAGSLVPDEIVNALVADRTERPDCKCGFILDGYPRTVAQASIVDAMLKQRAARTLVVHLKVDYNVIVDRLAARRLCPICGAVSGMKPGEPGTRTVCGLDGAKLIVRDDDRPEVVRKRLQNYDKQTAPVLEFFAQAGYQRLDVDGDLPGGPEAISHKIQASIREYVELAGRGA
jgi:adenylate kinase